MERFRIIELICIELEMDLNFPSPMNWIECQIYGRGRAAAMGVDKFVEHTFRTLSEKIVANGVVDRRRGEHAPRKSRKENGSGSGNGGSGACGARLHPCSL